jgi:hypothetical protein
MDWNVEVSGESGKKDKGRVSPSYWGETAALLHTNMGDAAAPTTIMELVEIDMEIEVEAAEDKAEPADAGTAPSVEKVIGEELPADSKTYLKSKDAIDAFHSPNQVPTLPSTPMVPMVSALQTPTNREVPLNTDALAAIWNTQEVLVYRNICPKSTGNGITFASMTIYHKVHGTNPGATVYGCIKGTFKLLLKADLLTSIQALYKDKGSRTMLTAPIKSLHNLPLDMMGLANYVQVSNTYTLSPAFGKDAKGNKNLQCLTWVFLRMKTMYLFTHLVGLIQPSLNTLNVSLKEKEMPYLDTKTCITLVGTTNELCPVALQHTLLIAL